MGEHKKKMVHIFVHHAEGAQGHAIAALVRHCVTQTHRQFRFLEVDGPASMQRMKRFLQQHGLQRSGVKLPFVILVEPEARDTTIRRSVLHGAALHQWLAEMVDALLATPGMSPLRAHQMFLDPFISPHILRLVRYAIAAETRPPPMTVEHIPTSPPTPTPPPPPAFVEELPDEAGRDDEGMLVDAGVTMTMASLRVPKTGTKEKAGMKGRKDIDHLQDAKARDAMVQRNTWYTP